MNGWDRSRTWAPPHGPVAATKKTAPIERRQLPDSSRAGTSGLHVYRSSYPPPRVADQARVGPAGDDPRTWLPEPTCPAWPPPHPALTPLPTPTARADVPLLAGEAQRAATEPPTATWDPPHPHLRPRTIESVLERPMCTWEAPHGWAAPQGWAAPEASIAVADLPFVESFVDPTGHRECPTELPPQLAWVRAANWPAPDPNEMIVDEPEAAPRPRRRRTGFRVPAWAWVAACAAGLMIFVFGANRADDPTLTAEFDASAPAQNPSAGSVVAQLGPPRSAGPFLQISGATAGTANDEWVQLANIGDAPAVMDGWSVGDDGFQHRYIFDAFVLEPGASVTIFSGCGTNAPNVRFWCSDDDIWNDGGDVVTVFDADESVVAQSRL